MEADRRDTLREGSIDLRGVTNVIKTHQHVVKNLNSKKKRKRINIAIRTGVVNSVTKDRTKTLRMNLFCIVRTIFAARWLGRVTMTEEKNG